MNSVLQILLILYLGSFCNSCGNGNHNFQPNYPQTEEQLMQEVKKNLNILEKNLKADVDFPAVKKFWDLIRSSNYLGNAAYTSVLAEVNKSSLRVLNLLKSYNPRIRSLSHGSLVSAVKDLMATFTRQAASRLNKSELPKHGFLNVYM